MALCIKVETIPAGEPVASATVSTMINLDGIPRGYGVHVSTVGPPTWESRGFISSKDPDPGVWTLIARVAAWAASEAEKR